MENVFTALIIAIVTGTLSPALLLYMKNRSDRREREAREKREDAKEEKADAARIVAQAALEQIKKQTDGVLLQVAALAKSSGHIEGAAEATKAAEGTATTLALGQQQGRDAERESIASKTKHDSDQPLPVVDKITNETGERAAAALEKMADTGKAITEIKPETKKE